MAAIAVSTDGECIFVALEDSATGNQIIAKASRDDLSTWVSAYAPGAGSAANVTPNPANDDEMFFYGNFGADIGLIRHVISTMTNNDITPSALGTSEINTLHINPSNDNELVMGVDTDQDLNYSDDQAASVAAWDAALGFDATALWVFWSGAYALHRYFVAGDNGLDLDLKYSPNEGASDNNEENAGLAAQAQICSLEATEA